MSTVTRVIGAVILAAGLGGLGRGGSAGAQIGGSAATFTLVARADPVGVDIVAARAPVVPGGNVAFLAPASAQSSFDSLGGSRGYASAPYAGDFVMSLPGTYNGLAHGKTPPVPAFPFYVTSEYPTNPGQGQEVGPYVIRADSTAEGSKSEARVGISTNPPQVASATARTTVGRQPGSGLLSAEAVSETAPFSVSEVLRIGDVRSTLRLAYDPARPDQGVRKERHLEIGQMTVAGVKVGFGPGGLVAGDRTAVPFDAPALEQKLADSGISLRYVPGTDTPTSASSDSLQVTVVAELPSLGTTTVRFILGRVAATLDPGTPLDLDLPAGAGVVIPPSDAGSPPPSSPSPSLPPGGDAAGGPPGAPFFAAAPDGSFGATAPEGAGLRSGPPDGGPGVAGDAAAGSGAAAGPTVDGSQVAAPATTVGRPPSTDRVFRVLAVAGAMMLLSSRSLRWAAFRQRLGARAPMAGR